MTMPHLMNCGHMDDGWCLDCVKAEWERTQDVEKWWSERDDEFYAMCRNLDFSALAAHIQQLEAERDETKNRMTLLEEIIRTKIATIDRLSKEKAGGHLAEKQVVEQRTEIASLHQHIEKVEAERDEARTRLAEAEATLRGWMEWWEGERPIESQPPLTETTATLALAAKDALTRHAAEQAGKEQG